MTSEMAADAEPDPSVGTSSKLDCLRHSRRNQRSNFHAEILQLRATGLSPRQIALRIGMNLRTVERRLAGEVSPSTGALAEEAALSHPWPGNVRELRHRVKREVALSPSEWIMPGDLFPERVVKSGGAAFVPLADVRDAAKPVRSNDRSGGQIAKAAALLALRQREPPTAGVYPAQKLSFPC
ncbi:hypothetical protein GCM10007880_60510 [Mesorhizobium amorphae]|uniref:hypothetical protein n=1 Tax=Mesorhizobium amorphae TaxID=71433 RepID=UPI00235C4A13|nr:hypothetical protein [Mesorhizobium amorphae]GLR45533.1 hypothetical protein GCM10007880_60510 [Mesorhizobium amorphae]